MVIAVLKTLMNCVSNNGVVLGLVVFAFKVVAAVISVLVCLGVYNKLTEKNRSVKNVLVAVIIFGVFAFFVNRLINGDRVLQKTRRQRRIVVTAGGLRSAGFVVH